MITFVTTWKNCLLNERKEVAQEFLEQMNGHMERNMMLQTIICDYGSEDNIKEVMAEKYPSLDHLDVEPNEGEFLNISKCHNKAMLFARNPIIAPIGTDFFFPQNTIEQIIIVFRALGAIVLRPELIYVDEDDKVYDHNSIPYVCLKKNIVDSKGWDERMFDWGKEEDDLILRLRRKQELAEFAVKGFGYTHRWHDRKFSKNEEMEQGNNYNILLDNIKNNGKNVVNTYWKIEN